MLGTSFFLAAGVFAAVGSHNAGIVETQYDNKPIKLIDKSSGKGIIKVKNRKNGKLLKKIRAFKKGGVDARPARLGTNGNQYSILAMQEKKGKFAKVYSRDGQLLAKRKVSKSKQIHEYSSGQLVKGDKENYIVVGRITGEDKNQVLILLYSYDENDRELQRVTSRTVTGVDAELIDGGFDVQIVKRQIRIKDENNKTVEVLTLDGKTLE